MAKYQPSDECKQASREFMAGLLKIAPIHCSPVRRIVFKPQPKYAPGYAGTEFDMGDALVRYNIVDGTVQLNLEFNRTKNRIQFTGIDPDRQTLEERTDPRLLAFLMLDKGLLNLMTAVKHTRQYDDVPLAYAINEELTSRYSINESFLKLLGLHAKLEGDNIYIRNR